MGASIQDLALYLNEAVQLRVSPEALDVSATTIDAQGLSQRVGCVVETVAGKRLGFIEGDVSVGFAFAVADAGVIPSLLAKKHSLGFTDNVAEGETVRVGNNTFEFAAGAPSNPSYIAVPLGDGEPETAAENLKDTYLTNPAIASVSLVNATTVTFEHSTIGFEVATDVVDVDQIAVVGLRDGAGGLGLIVQAGAPVTAGDTFDLTFGPITRPDGRVLAAVLASISVV